jgi:probable F420-dependent oxidoreductase
MVHNETQHAKSHHSRSFPMPQVGVLLDQHAYNMTPGDLANSARRIEALGFESVWLLDSFSRDPFIASAFVLGNTTTLKVGTGIATVYSRDAMAMTQARETLSDYYPGRFLMGLGASNETIVRMRGGIWVPPVPKMKAYLEAMTSTQLAHPAPANLAPLHLAAHAPGLQNLALKYASGIITWILPVESVRRSRAHIGRALEITANFPCILGDDPKVARKIGRDFMSFYISLDYYQRAYASIGFDASDFANGGSDRLIDAIVAWGSPEKIRERVQAYVEAGATRVVISPIRAVAGPQPNRVEGLEREWQADADLASLDRLAPVLL